MEVFDCECARESVEVGCIPVKEVGSNQPVQCNAWQVLAHSLVPANAAIPSEPLASTLHALL